MQRTSGQGTYKKILVFLSIIVLVPITLYLWQKTTYRSLDGVLELYGIKTQDEKNALLLIMRKADLIKPTQSFMDIFPLRNNDDALVKDILDFIRMTQSHFTIRKGSQERWQVQPRQWMSDQDQELKAALKQLGFISAITPQLKKPAILSILGAHAKSMKNRLNYASKLVKTEDLLPEHLVLLTGERHVTVGIDGTLEELTKIAQQQGVSFGDLTETHILKDLYWKSALNNLVPVDVIDTPKDSLPRPTTETTLMYFCEWIKQHPHYRSVLFVSNQPYVFYQGAVIGEVIKTKCPRLAFEVVGEELSPEIPIKEPIGALGSYLWARTPYVLLEIHPKITDAKLREEFLNLYAQQPLMFKNVETILKPIN